MVVADFLSRNCLPQCVGEDESMKDYVHTVGVLFDCSDSRKEKLKHETASDPVLSQIIKFYKNGWPNMVPSDSELQHYFNLKNEITVDNGLVFFNDRLIIPPTSRKTILSTLHETHLGLYKIKNQAKQFFYWAGMMSEINNLIDSCAVCQKLRRSQIKEPLLPHDIPPLPFMKIGMDVLEFSSEIYLVIIDYYSRWIELERLNSKSSKSIITTLKPIFSRFGIPKIIVADNNPFNSFEFHKFAHEWNFQLTTSSPHYPKSNGLAEKAVGIVKSMLKKCSVENQDINMYLLNYRNACTSGLDYSPAQLLQSRSLRTKLPIDDKHFKPKVVDDPNVYSKRNQASYYNLHSRAPIEFVRGENVLIQDKFSKLWEEGVIVNKLKFRSYLVKINGKMYRRNSTFIRKNKSPPKSSHLNHLGFINCEDSASDNYGNIEGEIPNDTVSGPDNDVADFNCNVNGNNLNSYATRSGRTVKKPNRLNL